MRHISSASRGVTRIHGCGLESATTLRKRSGWRGGEQHRREAAPVVAGEVDALEPERVEQRDQVADEDVGLDRPGRRVGPAEAAQVGVDPALAGTRRLIAPDLRGFGWTDAPPGPMSPTSSSRDLIALLDALGLERVDLAGHDWGGFTSLLLAARHPERFRKVVALSSPHPWLRITPRLALETWRAWYAVLLAAGLMERTPKLAEWFIRREGVPPTTRPSTSSACATRPRRGDHTSLPRLPADVARHGEGRRGGAASDRAGPPVIGEKDMAVTPRLAAGLGAAANRASSCPGAGHFVCERTPTSWPIDPLLPLNAACSG